MQRYKDLSGEIFERLKVIKRIKNKYKSHVAWECICDCGKIVETTTQRLKNGDSKSCGCLNNEKRKIFGLTHGMSKLKEYNIWLGIKARCLNKNNPGYKKWYGSKGVSICDEWNRFENFYRDMGEIPSNKHEIDRINPNGNYEKSNCRWVTKSEQLQNRRKKINCSSKFIGVCFDKSRNKYMAGIKKDGTKINIGRYESEIEAALAYNMKAIELFGDNARINKVEE